MITQRAERSGSVLASASRISWSSAPRRSGFEIRSRAMSLPGSSSSSLPDARSRRLLKDHQYVAFFDRLALLALDLAHRAVELGLHRHLHLHRLEHGDRVSLRHLL